MTIKPQMQLCIASEFSCSLIDKYYSKKNQLVYDDTIPMYCADNLVLNSELNANVRIFVIL